MHTAALPGKHDVMVQQDMIPHLFRTEFRKITAVICKLLGIEHLKVAEDIASDTFLVALETWPYDGVPENPAAWLYAVARNKTLNYIKRQKLFRDKITGQLSPAGSQEAAPEIDLSEKNIEDSQLQMLFAICHPSLPVEAQIGLALRALCGFGIEEIAAAFLTNKETINKRLFRAREKLRQQNASIAFPAEKEIGNRLKTVLTTLYLLFNEGYYSETHNSILREEFCLEAMRLTHLLTMVETTNTPAVNALLALMCFHASRFPARKTPSGELVLYDEQDESLWNQDLISRGAQYFRLSSSGTHLTKYHLEAGIAFWQTIKADTLEKWENILQLYNHLLYQEYSPLAALNRTYALARARGRNIAIAEAEKLQLVENPYYHILLAELYAGFDPPRAADYLRRAASLVKTSTERSLIERKLASVQIARFPEPLFS